MPRPPRSVNRWVWISLAVIIVIFIFVRIGSLSSDQDGLGLGAKVGIVKLTGLIVNTEQLVKELDEFARRDDIKAIVLRIESPGGSVAPSQEIYEKVKSLKGVKPVIVSIGSMAASGGYYAALESAVIVANKGSITGSIGVILDYPVAVNLLEKIGLRFETVKSGALKDAGSPTREVLEEDRQSLQNVVNDLHRQFIQAVAEGRNLDLTAVENLADGRVFTGLEALEYGLIDTLGTFEDAIKIAGELGSIEGIPRTVRMKKTRPTLLDFIFGDWEESARTWFQVEPVYRWR